MLVTGGADTLLMNTAEVLNDDGTTKCSFPILPEDRRHHTQSGLVICGGGWESDIQTSCLTFSSGKWTKSHTLQFRRKDHSVWSSPQGLLLMGGAYNLTSTEILTDDGQSIEHFTLKHDTR